MARTLKNKMKKNMERTHKSMDILSDVLNGIHPITPGVNSGKVAYTVQQKDGQKQTVYWEKNEMIGDRVDTVKKYHQTMKDSIGTYDFDIRPCDRDNVYITVEGTHRKHNKMDKKRAIWEWDMVWDDIGIPKILTA
jgi:hypothetical protein